MARQFGHTWWGKAWLDALEQRALVDPNRLPRGRTYARQDRVIGLELGPGELRSRVRGTEIYTTSLYLRVLTDAEWDAVLDTVMTKASNAAALLAGEVPSAIGDLVLPDRGDLGPECSCPDWAEPCKHVAALCYVAADLFDADPFALLTLRGRSRDQVLTEVRARRSKALGTTIATSSDLPRGSDPGVSASNAFKRSLQPLDTAAMVPRRPAGMIRLADPGADAGIDIGELGELVADAARRAWSMLAEDGDSGLGLSVAADVVRRATTGNVEAIAAATGLDDSELRAAALAWQVGGQAGYEASRVRSQPPDTALLPGKAALGSDARVRANAVSRGNVQLRLDSHGNWWRFRADDELGWVLAEGPALDPLDLLADLAPTRF